MNFIGLFNKAVGTTHSRLCIGLDPEVNLLPLSVKNKKRSLFLFNKTIIDATHDLVCAYKPNSAFYESSGAGGILELKMTCDYIKKNYPKILIFLDAKRADIGNTNRHYVEYAFGYLGVDAITLHPYLGEEGIAPFLERSNKGCIILCRTSNPGAREFQNLKVDGALLYQTVAKQVAQKWNSRKNCMLVVGATYPSEMKEIRKLAPNVPFLIPGIGAQGGDLEASITAGIDSRGGGIVIAVSRTVLYTSGSGDFALAARKKAKELRDQIDEIIQRLS